jgi:hypothetical protein
VDLLTAILACSVYTSDDALVRAIAESNSHGNQFSVLDASAQAADDPRQTEPRSLEAAMARLEDVRASGGAPLLGWMQLPPSWVTMYGRELREAFDPCVNISIGTAMLSQFDYECSSTTTTRFASHTPPRGSGSGNPLRRTERRKCVVRKYGEAIALPDFELVTALEVRAQRRESADGTTNSPIEWARATHPWGANCLLFPRGGATHGPLEGATGRQPRE